MTINHHPDDSTLMAYAAGTLDEAFAVVVSCHLQVCNKCREAVKTGELVGGVNLEQTEEATLSQGSFGRLLEKISVDTEGGVTDTIELNKSSSSEPQEWSTIPRALQHYIDTDIDNIAWTRFGPGIWQHTIDLSDDAKSSLRLLRIAHGKEMPEHGHGGHELTLILRGAYKDKFGLFSSCDIADLDDDVDHQPTVVSEEDCICLVATEAPTKFKGLVGKLLQPLMRI